MKIIKTYESFDFKKLDLGRFNGNINKFKLFPNPDGTYDYDGDLSFKMMNLHSLLEIPIRFKKIDGDFICSYNNLVSLEGCPEIVNKFVCSRNKLISLQYLPKEIKGNIHCGENPLLSIKHLSEFDKRNNFIEYSGWISDFERIKDDVIKTIKDMTFDQRVNELKFFKEVDLDAYENMLQTMEDLGLGYGEETKKMSDYVDVLTNAKEMF